MNDDDDNTLPRARWIPWAIGLLVLCMVLGMANLAWMMLTDRLGPTDKSAPPPASPVVPAPAASAPAASPAPPASAPAPEVSQAPAAPAGGGTTARALAQPDGLAQCMRCHAVQRRAIGPAFTDIAARYQGRDGLQDYLAGKIRGGSVGEWGRVIMPRQVQVSEAQAQAMAQWIMALPLPAQPRAAGG